MTECSWCHLIYPQSIISYCTHCQKPGCLKCTVKHGKALIFNNSQIPKAMGARVVKV